MNVLYKNDEEVDEFYTKISRNIKTNINKLGLSQLLFSQNVGFNSVSYYCDCENRKNSKHFNLIHVVKIAKFLDVDINKLLV